MGCTRARVVTAEVTLVARAGSPVANLVGALSELGPLIEDDWCVVGGLAVFCRVGTEHRVTADVDAVVRSASEVSVLRRLADRGLDVDRQRVKLAAVDVDVIEIDDLQPSAAMPDDPLDRLFVIGHHVALRTAEPLQVRVMGLDGGAIAEATARVATAPALIATKLHAYHRRRGDVARKKAGDALDLFALMVGADGATYDAIRGNSFGLAQLMATLIDDAFAMNAAIAAARIRNTMGRSDVTDRMLREAAQAFVAALR